MEEDKLKREEKDILISQYIEYSHIISRIDDELYGRCINVIAPLLKNNQFDEAKKRVNEFFLMDGSGEVIAKDFVLHQINQHIKAWNEKKP